MSPLPLARRALPAARLQAPDFRPWISGTGFQAEAVKCSADPRSRLHLPSGLAGPWCDGAERARMVRVVSGAAIAGRKRSLPGKNETEPVLTVLAPIGQIGTERAYQMPAEPTLGQILQRGVGTAGQAVCRQLAARHRAALVDDQTADARRPFDQPA